MDYHKLDTSKLRSLFVCACQDFMKKYVAYSLND